jgi:hypothetical protein
LLLRGFDREGSFGAARTPLASGYNLSRKDDDVGGDGQRGFLRLSIP